MPKPVKFKTDEDGKILLEENQPVMEFDDGTTSPVDVVGAFAKWETKEANFEEAKVRHEGKLKEIQDKLKTFENIDPEKYKEAMKTITALKDKKLVDEQGLEAYKNQMNQIFNEEKKSIHDSYKKQMVEKDESLVNLDKVIYDLAIKNKFANDKHFSGNTPITIYNPDDAAKIYGDHFKVEVNGSKYKITAIDKNGNPILSKKNHGEPAEFDEAIAQIIANEAKSKPILRNARTGGPVTSGNMDSGGDPDLAGKTSTEKIKAGLKKRYSGTRF